MMFDNLTLVSRSAKPILNPGKNYQWDAFDVHSHYTMYDVASRHYRIYYNNTTKALGHKSGIGMAFSETGLDTFVSSAMDNPLLKSGGRRAWDRWLWKVRVIRLGEEDWRMWYGGFNVEGFFLKKVMTGVGYAVSGDGLHWEKFNGNPIITREEKIYDFTPIFTPRSREHKFRALYYSGNDSSIGLMKSKDGINWDEKFSYPVLEALPNSWEKLRNDGMICPKWLGLIDNIFVLAYEAGPTGRYCVGLAYSKDLVHWWRDMRNPILTPRQGFFDSRFVADPSLVINGDEMRLYYGAKDDVGRGYVGLAVFIFNGVMKG